MRLNIPQDLNTHFQNFKSRINPLNAELNPICYLLALLGAHHFLHVSRIRVKQIFIITKSVSKCCITIFILCIVKIKTVEALSYNRNVSGSIPDRMNKNFIVCLCMTTLTEVFPCFLLSCKANARVKPTKTGHGPHCS